MHANSREENGIQQGEKWDFIGADENFRGSLMHA